MLANDSPPPIPLEPLPGPPLADESPPPLICGQQAPVEGDEKGEMDGGAWEGVERQQEQQQEEQEQGFVPYGLRAGRDLVDQQTSGFHVRPHEKPPPLYQATLGLAATYRHVTERRGKVRPRGGWAGTATGETRLFTSDDGTLRLGPHLPLLMGRYRFLRPVGQGTFAQIVCAEDTLHPGRRRVAVKILNFHYGEVGKREALCLRVAQEAGPEGQHAAIVQLLGAFDFMGHFCLVLELCQGGSLQAFVKPLAPPPPPLPLSPASSPAAIAAMPTLPTTAARGGNHNGVGGGGGMPLAQLREVALHLAKALLLLHNHDVIHADLKPENVLLLSPPPRSSPSGSGGSGVGGGLGPLVRLTDLGNAIKSREVKLYKEDYEIQTLGYRAPEVLLGGCGGQAFGHAIDLWSLGVLLVELHLGRPLFRAPSQTLMVKRILSVLGPLPAKGFVTGKFYAALFGADHRLRPAALALPDDPAHAATALVDPVTVQNAFRYDANAHLRLVRDLLGEQTRDQAFIGFVAGLLQLDPAARLTAVQALMHPFLAPCFPFALLRPHLAPGVLRGMAEQQRRQLQGDEQGRAVIRPGSLHLPPEGGGVGPRQAGERAGAAALTGVVKAEEGGGGRRATLEAPDSDRPHQPSASSIATLSLAPESPPRASEEEERDEGGQGVKQSKLQRVEREKEGRMAPPSPSLSFSSSSRKRQRHDGGRGPHKRDGERERDRKLSLPPAAHAAAVSPSPSSKKRKSPATSNGGASSTSARKWWEADEEDGDEEEEIVDATPRSRAVQPRPFAEEKAAGGRDDDARRRRRAPLPSSPLESAAGDDISEDELIL